MTLCNDDVILTSLKHAVFTRKRETTEFIPPIPWPPNSPDLNPVVYSMWGTVQEVYKTCTTDLNDLKHRITEWAKLDHAVIAAAVYHNGIVSQRASTLVALILNTVFWWRHVFTVITATFLAVADQSNSCTLIGRSGLIAVVSWLCVLQRHYMVVVYFTR